MHPQVNFKGKQEGRLTGGMDRGPLLKLAKAHGPAKADSYGQF